MAITRFGNNYYEGLTADTPPTNVAAGSIFKNTQTDEIYEFNGTTWDLIIGHTKTETLENKTLTNPTINSATVDGTITLSPTATSPLEYVKAHTDGTPEVLAKWRLDEDVDSNLTLENTTTVHGSFAPSFWFRQNGLAGVAAGYIVVQIDPSIDTGTIPTFIFDVRLSTGAAITTRPLLDIRTFGTSFYNFTFSALTFRDGKNITVGSSSGTKIGTATTQKLGFFNATPVVQPAANPDTSGATLANLEIEVNQLKATLRSLGLLA